MVPMIDKKKIKLFLFIISSKKSFYISNLKLLSNYIVNKRDTKYPLLSSRLHI